MSDFGGGFSPHIQSSTTTPWPASHMALPVELQACLGSRIPHEDLYSWRFDVLR
jgi:hypothetical protein